MHAHTFRLAEKGGKESYTRYIWIYSKMLWVSLSLHSIHLIQWIPSHFSHMYIFYVYMYRCAWLTCVLVFLFFFVVCFFQVLNFSFCFLVLVIVCSFGTNGSSPMQKLTDTIYQWERDKVAKQTEVQMDKNIVENKWIKWKIK